MLSLIIITSGIVIYTYILYPAILFLVSTFRKSTHEPRSIYQPLISMIIPVYNGEAILQKKIEDIRSIEYPTDRLEIIFVSDGSDDNTNDILRRQKNVIFIQLANRSGKEAAIKAGLKQAHGDLVCLSDTGVMMNPSGLASMAGHFREKHVGAVSSVDKTDFGTYSLETFHVDFENKIRVFEAVISSSVGVSGSFFMTRKKLLENVPLDSCSDLAIVLECVRNGYKAIVEPRAYGEYRKSDNVRVELDRKTRTVVHGMKTLLLYKDLLNPFRYGLFAWQLISHKVFRWLSPISLTTMTLLLLILIFSKVSLLNLGVALVLVALLLIFPGTRKLIINNIALFVTYNIAPIASVCRLILNKDARIWNPTKRS